MDIKKGTIIKSSKWDESLQVEIFENRGDGIYRILAIGTESNTAYHEILDETELSEIETQQQQHSFTEDPEEVFLALENIRYQFVSNYDPLYAINTSKVDPLPHQIEAVYGKVLKLPRVRFLIADDPGAGKTIMAGLIIKELILRQLIKNILIVGPGHLKYQWQREMKEKFGENFTVINRSLMDAHYGENIWQRENHIITSLDFAKRDDILPTIEAANFDLVIVDEAHKMSAYQYNETKIEKSKRYKLGEVLSQNSEHLLFLTATPHKGDPDNFRLFIDLLQPGFFATNEILQESIEQKDNPLFIRRSKEDLKDFSGKPLFLPRHVNTIGYNWKTESQLEMELYNDLSKYVKKQYGKALTKNKKNNVAFALVILQRRVASSTYALYQSLKRRQNKLEDLLAKVESGNISQEAEFSFDETEDMSEEDRWKEEEIWETLSVSENREELKSEIETLKKLQSQAKYIIDNNKEIKLNELRKTLDNLKVKAQSKKIIVFTEAKDTLEYLYKRINNDWGYNAITIHGGMKLEERSETEKLFKNEDYQVLIATEAAGEGINLQFCNLMINYDIPWNPNRLEQRMGRIHRYGQQHEVFIYNLVARNTREGDVLLRLFQKLEEIKDALGNDKVFDVISEVLSGKNLSQLLIDAAVNARSADEIIDELDIEVDEEYISQIKENLGDTLATRFIDYSRIEEMNEKAREYRLIPEYTEAFFKLAFEKSGGNLNLKGNGKVNISKIPYSIKEIANQPNFKKLYGPIVSKYPKATFDKDIAFKDQENEFISFGHPLFEAVSSWINSKFRASIQDGAIFSDPEEKLDGFIFYYEGEIKDGKRNTAGKRLFAYYYDKKNQEISKYSPQRIWELSFQNNHSENGYDLEDIKGNINAEIIHNIREYKNEILEERQRQANIKKKYGVKSLEKLIIQLDGDLIDLYSRRENGEKVDLPIRNKENQKIKYQEAKERLEKTIEQEQNLLIQNPRFFGAIRVIPSPSKLKGMVSDPDVEKAGMDYVMEYEKKHGRKPKDICQENLGYDIYSEDNEGNKRRIEVKARAKIGNVALTINEWFKAKRFRKEFYLYVVYNAVTNPELIIINDPYEYLKAFEEKEIVRYIVTEEEIKNKGDKQQ